MVSKHELVYAQTKWHYIIHYTCVFIYKDHLYILAHMQPSRNVYTYYLHMCLKVKSISVLHKYGNFTVQQCSGFASSFLH